MLFVLLPGAGCEPWIWHRVVDELQQRGHEAIGVRLPYDDERAGLSQYADAVAGAIGTREDVSSPLAIDAWPDVPTRALAGRRDRFFPLEFQRRVARERLQLELDEIGSGHSPMLACPGELAARLTAYADEL